MITAGNASQISDGAAALLMTTSREGGRARADPIARVHTAVLAGDDPVIMLTGADPGDAEGAGPQRALRSTTSARSRSTRRSRPVPLAWLAETGADPKRLNPHGGAIALGHPLGASGARLMTTLVHHMRDDGIRYGLQTMCEGGGHGQRDDPRAGVGPGYGSRATLLQLNVRSVTLLRTGRA